MEMITVRVEIPEGCNVILGQTHFIKTAEDLYEIIATTVPQARFGVGFTEASGPCLIRTEGNDEGLIGACVAALQSIGAGTAAVRKVLRLETLLSKKRVRNRKTTFLHQCTRNRFLTSYLPPSELPMVSPELLTGIRSWLCALRLQGDTFFRKDASVRHVAVSERRSSSRSSSTVFNSASNARAAIPKRASRNLSMAFRVVSRVHSALSSSSNGDSIIGFAPSGFKVKPS